MSIDSNNGFDGLSREEKFEDVLKEAMQLTSDIRHAMDLIEIELAAWQKRGVKSCTNEMEGGPLTKCLDRIESADEMVGFLSQFFILAGSYHVDERHLDLIPPGHQVLREIMRVQREGILMHHKMRNKNRGSAFDMERARQIYKDLMNRGGKDA